MTRFLKTFFIAAILSLFSLSLFAETESELVSPEEAEIAEFLNEIITEPSETRVLEETEENLSSEDASEPEKEEQSDSEPEEQVLYPLIEAYKDHPEVEAWRQYYLKSEKRIKLLHDILEYAMEYRLYVRKTVRDRNLPGELEYLPVVESGYKTSAKSKSGAVGMWQFMENSVRPFLTLNEYVDERLDPWRSTEGGLSKLQDNYRTFNDWLLAAGAYNCGVGAMNKAIRKAESRDFWYLAENGFISSQTKDYVPKLIAIADLAVNAEEYEIYLPDHKEEFENLTTERDGLFDYVTVSRAYSLSSIARDMRIDERQMKRLNPSLVKGFTPPAAPFKIRVPLGMGTTCQDVVSKLTPIEFPFQYKVTHGDSLWSISRRFGTTVKAICDTNGIEENAILKIGKILYIPAE